MTTPTIHGPGELIASLPAMLGTTPDDVVVVLGLDDDGAVVAASSLDRVDLCVPELSPGLATGVAHDLLVAGIEAVIAVSWQDTDPSLPCPALAELLPELRDHGLLAAGWVTDGALYWSPECADEDCCPPQGRPVPASPLVPPILGARRARHAPLAALPHLDRDTRRRAARAADRWISHRDADRARWCTRSWEHIVASRAGEVDAPAWGKVVAALQDVRVRDAVIVLWLGGGPSAVTDVLAAVPSRAVHEVMDGALRPGNATVPDPDVLAGAHEWCAAVGAHARERERAAVHALRAVLAWWEADLGVAQEESTRALTCDPGYTLAMLIGEMCVLGLGPGWRRPDPAA